MNHRIYGLIFAVAMGGLSAWAASITKDRLSLANPDPAAAETAIKPCYAYGQDGGYIGACNPAAARGP